jgi:hypothetical protein
VVKYTSCPELGYSEDKIWKGHNNGKSRFETANFVKVLLHDEETIAMVEDESPEQQPVAKLAEERTNMIDVLIEDEFQARITQDEEFRTELSDTNKAFVQSAQDGTSADLVEATSGMENHTQLVSKEPPVDTILELPKEQVLTKDEAKDLTPEEQPVEELMKEAGDADLQQDEGMDSEIAKNKEERSSRGQSREGSGGEVCVEQIEALI